MEYRSLNSYLIEKFGEKVYKIAIDGGMTCPNRDGRVGYGGCIFCNESGSGDFAGRKTDSITKQIEDGKARLENKINNGKYIAYFQAFTNTYASIDYLEKIFTEAIDSNDIVGLSIATRPDCLEDDIIDLIDRLNKIKPVWVELGLQTIHEKTSELINRGYSLECFETNLDKLRKHNIETIIHVILGLPYEDEEDMYNTIRYLATKDIQGIKLQLLHVIQNTRLAKMYANGEFEVLTLEQYSDIVCKCIELLPDNIVIHRITGDGNKDTLIAPLWSKNKKNVLNTINRKIRLHNS